MKLFGGKVRNRLKRKFTESGIEYTFQGVSGPIFPLNANPSDMLAKLLAQGELWASLDALWAEGLLEECGANRWRVPYKAYDYLDGANDDGLYQILELPKPTPFQISTRAFSNVGKEDFRIHVEATHPEHGPLRENDPPRYGRAFLITEDDIVPLTAPQANLFDIAQGTNTNWDNVEERMAYLAATKDAANRARAKIDQYLASEEYEFRTDADLNIVDRGPEELVISPEIDGLDTFGIEGQQILGGDIPGVISKPGSAMHRKRMVLAKPLRQQLGQLPEEGKITGTDVPRFLTQPESMIPEGFDLSMFSERVKGIKTRVYNSRPYIHVSQNKGGGSMESRGLNLKIGRLQEVAMMTKAIAYH